ncbi:MAG: NAD(+) diphosphatase [Propioniciclava sp.]
MESWVSDSRFDRALEYRADESWLSQMWAHPQARVVEIDEQSRISATVDSTQLRSTPPRGSYDAQRHYLLGLVDEDPWFGMAAAGDGPFALAYQLNLTLDETATDLVMTALALVGWHQSAPFCSRCGSLTEVRAGGQHRWCEHCTLLHFPRTDPAVIVAVVDPADRLLLAHQRVWDPHRMSLLAGFVEAGESLEQAVHREIAEESGVRLTQVRYLDSQPWPFPRSLMLGFVGVARDSEIQVDGVEIEYARYFSREELTAAVDAGEVLLPGQISIAHRIITAWRAGALPAGC